MKPLRHVSIQASPSNVTPLGDFVLVKPLLEPEKSGSIFLPDNARNPERGLRRGVVVAVGPGDKVPHECERNTLDCFGTADAVSDGQRNLHRAGLRRAPMDIKIGDCVLYPRVPANVVRLDGEEYILLHEEQHCLAVIEP